MTAQPLSAGQPVATEADLAQLLATYSSGSITSIATFHGLTKKGPKGKQQAIEELTRILAQPSRIQQTWQALSMAERAAVQAILQRGGQMLVRTLHQLLAGQGLIDSVMVTPASFGPNAPKPITARAATSRRLEDILARLTLRGLVFAADDPPNAFPGSPHYEAPKRDIERPMMSLLIPELIRRHLPEPPPLASVDAPLITVGAQQAGSARIFQRDLYLFWSFLRGQPLSLTIKDEPRKPQLKEINATLLERAELAKGQGELDHPRLRFVRLLLETLGLAQTSADNSMTVTANTAFFGLAPAARVRQSFEAWRDQPFFNELLLLPTAVRPARLDAVLLEATDDVLNARRTVLGHIRSLTATGDWVAFDTLAAALHEHDYEFLFRRPPLPDYQYGYPYGRPAHPYSASTNPLGIDFPGIRDDEAGWNLVEANFIRGIIIGPLTWMGLADLGWPASPKTPEPPVAFRLTALGRWLLADGPEPAIPVEGGRVIVQPNLHVTALDPVNDATLVTLDRFAERLSAERAVEYRLTRESVYAGQREGWDAQRIRDFLRQQTGVDLPGNVTRTLDEWQAQHERIILYTRVTLVHGAAAALDKLAQHRETATLLLRRPAPEVLLLQNPEAIPPVTQILAGQGLLPLVTRGAELAPNAVEADETGEIRLLAPRPNLFLHGHLASLADPAGDRHYQLSAATVARAVRAGLSAPEIIERLQTVHRGPVPAGLIRRVRAWARHYGEAALEDLVLLQIRDAATLDELMADPDVARVLQPFTPAPKKALARVKREDLAALRALLADRGVELKNKLG